MRGAMRAFVAIGIVFFLTSCSRWEAKSAVKKLLNDPDSAQFSGLMDGTGKGNVCGFVNAKNRMGGYVGATPFFYEAKYEKTAIVPPTKDSDFRDLYNHIELGWDFSDELNKLSTKCELEQEWKDVCGIPYPGQISRFCSEVNNGKTLYKSLRAEFN